MMPDPEPYAHAAAAIESAGYATVQDFLPAETVATLARECRDLARHALLVPAAVGHAAARTLDATLRGDRTRWLDAGAATPAQRVYFERMQMLRQALNRRLLLGLETFEAHFGLYPAGARYARHRDRFRDDDTRVLSCVLYLNGAWRVEDGGALRLYHEVNPAAPYRDIRPVGGLLVLFLSADFDHEVLPARRERLSIAGWFRRTPGAGR